LHQWIFNLEGEEMKKIKIEDAVGMVLGHDVTQIIPGMEASASIVTGVTSPYVLLGRDRS
jgi:hypothetical protein